MNFSLILTVHNGENNLMDALKSIHSLNYPKKLFELIVVNDGSTDNTLKLLKKFKHINRDLNLSIINSKNNLGRIKSRIKGASLAKFDRIIIMDVQQIPEKKYLEKVSKYSINFHLISNVTMDKYLNLENRVIFLLRQRIYKPFWGNHFPNVDLNLSNFYKISKGTGGFVTNKQIFLNLSRRLNGDKSENEDTKLFKMYLEENYQLKRISDASLLYKNRSGVDSMIHLFKRGPRFVDYYFQNQFYLKVTMLALLLIFTLIFAVFNPLSFLGFCLLILVTMSILLSQELSDMPYLILGLPLVIIPFLTGVICAVAIGSIKNVRSIKI